MKKSLSFGAALLVAMVLNGCGGDYQEGYQDGFYDGSREPGTGLTTLFFSDKEGFSVGGVHYVCIAPDGAVTDDYVTAPNGEFSFVPGERCTFDFVGLQGTPADPIFIEDDVGRGKGDIPYNCAGGDAGTTYPDGSFEYLPNDTCTFYF